MRDFTGRVAGRAARPEISGRGHREGPQHRSTRRVRAVEFRKWPCSHTLSEAARYGLGGARFTSTVAAMIEHCGEPQGVRCEAAPPRRAQCQASKAAPAARRRQPGKHRVGVHSTIAKATVLTGAQPRPGRRQCPHSCARAASTDTTSATANQIGTGGEGLDGGEECRRICARCRAARRCRAGRRWRTAGAG